jgi:protein TonB
MFQTFDQPVDTEATRRLSAAALAATVVIGGLFTLMLVSAARAEKAEAEKIIPVAFRPPPPVKKAEPPPPPPAPKVARPKPPPQVAAPVTPTVAMAEPAAAPIVAPKEVPKVKAPEATADNAVAAIAVAVGGTGDGSGTAVGNAGEQESAAPVVASAGASGPVNLPEEAEPPEPAEDNAAPEYPESARASGVESVVVLKVVIEKNGSVGRIQVMKGEEPFVSAAVTLVKTWKYSPATLDGTPIATFKIVKVSYRLRKD